MNQRNLQIFAGNLRPFLQIFRLAPGAVIGNILASPASCA